MNEFMLQHEWTPQNIMLIKSVNKGHILYDSIYIKCPE